MRLKGIIIIIGLLLVNIQAFSQETVTPNDVHDERVHAYAFINAHLFVDYQTEIKNATLLIKEGKVIQIGANLTAPLGYIVVDLKGKYIYPSLIDLHTHYGLPKVALATSRGFTGAEQMLTKTPGAYNANEAIKSDFDASEVFNNNEKAATIFRKIGFGSVLSFRADGIARGTSTFTTLGDNPNKNILIQNAAAHYSLNKGTSKQYYPGSTMGYISLLRQTYLDAAWYGQFNPRPFLDQSLEAWIAEQNLPQFFDAGGWINVLRADKVGDEFGVQYVIKSGGDAYKRIEEIKATGATLIVPVNFPETYDIDDPIDAFSVSLADMKHWELAPSNLAKLEAAGINFAITSDGLTKKSDFLSHIRKAIDHGLSESLALKSLTLTPAELIQINHQVGSLRPNMLANFIITSGKLFDEKTIIHENWVQGRPYRFQSLSTEDYQGKYTLTLDNKDYEMKITGVAGSEKAQLILNDSVTNEIKSTLTATLATFSFPLNKKTIRLSGWRTDSGWKGTGQLADGKWVQWTSQRIGDIDPKEEKKKLTTPPTDALGPVIFPFIAFGNETHPQQQTLLIKNTTVWTNETMGILEDTDVLLKEGKISEIGKNLQDPSALVIDGRGKHLTSGIIDEHTHIGGGGNDRATNSSMVRIGDQLNSEDINIYRALAGGVTAVQVLHGSANPVGGQSALIKLRWGVAPDDLKIKNADGYIKFALGENVKRSRNPSSTRFPQTRMGVEQVYMDGFTQALAYDKEWSVYDGLPKKSKNTIPQPRRDLVDEAMMEIINKERFITCHSYVQSEINMLMKVAEQFNFNINTFTHILEGYKVADKMKAHGAGASTFSDWWNYKWEVRYAIPYNAAIMYTEGVVTAINSDDSNSGRRLNQEAAKSVKYGGLSEENVWKMVTLNPAKLLHLDDRMGSVKVGKDADIVLWTDHPLSVYAQVEKTIVDGIVYFDVGKDKASRVMIHSERARLIQKMKNAKKSGAPTKLRSSEIFIEFDCDDDHLATSFDLDTKE